MKNFRKVLALILVVATLCSLTALASAKSTEDYTDGDKISYVEAVDVLSAIGILEGYTDNSFQPTKNIQREEMAKMVAVLANAGDDVEELYASACQFTDSKNSWAASYIAYCTQLGIVAGRSSTTFDPDANVTGLETAKMLLVVLGFDATEQGYVGTNWKVNVLRDAKNFGLLNGFADGYDVSKAITREEAAQMFLNALQAPMVVGTISNNIIKVSNALYSDKADASIKNASDWTLTLKDADKWGETWTLVYGNVVVSNKPLATIYKGLTLDPARDCYGNPGYVWTYEDAKGKQLFSKFYATSADLSYTVAASLVKDLDTELKSNKGYTFTVYNDGLEVKQGTATNKAYLETAQDLTGNGVLTQVYVDDVNSTVVVTIKHTYIGEVEYITKKANTFTLTTGETYSNKGYDVEAGDIVLYWLCAADDNESTKVVAASKAHNLHDVKVIEPVVAQVTRVETASGDITKSNVTADGTKYVYAYDFGNHVESYHYDYASNRKDAEGNYIPGWGNYVYTNNDPLPADAVDCWYDLYLDEYGNIMMYRYSWFATEYEYAYAVEGTGKSVTTGLTGTGDVTYESTKDLVDFEANYNSNVAVDRATFVNSLVTMRDLDEKQATGLLFKYAVYDGVACFAEYPYVTTGNAVVNADGKITGAQNWVWDPEFENEDGTYGNWVAPEKNPDTIYGTSTTKYLVRTWDYSKGEYVYTAFTGKLDADYVGRVWDRSDLGDSHPTVQYFLDSRGYLSYVFVDAVYAETAQRAFVLGYTKSVSDSAFRWQIGAYDAYEAIINGERSYLLVTHTGTLLENTLYTANFECIGLEDDGCKVYYDATKVAADTGRETYEFYNDRIIVGGSQRNELYWLAEDAVVVVAFAGADHNDMDAVILEGGEEINDYFEDILSINGQGEAKNFINVEGWFVLNGNGEIAELYMVVTGDDYALPVEPEIA